MVNNIAGAIVRGRWGIVMLFVVATSAAVMQLGQFKVDASADTLLTKNNQLYIRTQVANQVFSPQEFILLAYEPTGHPLYSQQTFDDLSGLHRQIQTMPRVRSVTSILTVPLVDSADSLTGQTDVSQLTWQQQGYSPQKMRELTENHPIFTDLLLNEEGTATALQVVFKPNARLAELEAEITAIQSSLLTGQEQLTEEQQTQLNTLQQQADPLRQQLTEQRKQEISQLEEIASQVQGRANTYLGGSYVVGQHLIDIIQRDLMYFGAAIGLVIALLLALLYRSLKWVLFPLLACAVSVTLTIGLFAFLDMRATVISANFIALQLILTLAVMIHLTGCYRQISRDKPEYSQHQRVMATLADKLPPCFYAALTTSVGFGSLIFSGLHPVVDFGWMMLGAMGISMGVSLLLFLALLALCPASRESCEHQFINRALQRVRRWSLQAPGRIILVSTLLFALLTAGILRLDVENSFIDYFANDTQVHQQLKFIDQQFGGSTPMDIILPVQSDNRQPELVLSADSVNRLQIIQQVVEAHGAIGSATSLVNFTELARNINNDMPLTEYELTAIYHILDKQVVNQLVGSYLSVEDNQLRIATRVEDTLAGLDREQFLNQLRGDFAELGLSEQDYQLTNLFVLYQDILARLFDSQVTTLLIVYAVLLVVLLAVFRSASIAVIALIPNVLTTLGILGVMGWAGLPLDIMTITIAAIAMGIAVDDTIHFVHAWQRGYQQQGTGSGAVRGSRQAFAHTGLAILSTTTIIATGFSLLGFSDFLPSVYFGLLTALAMIMALVTDMTLLPAMLNAWVARSPASSSHAEEPAGQASEQAR